MGAFQKRSALGSLGIPGVYEVGTKFSLFPVAYEMLLWV